jgi:hypothetical protein
VNDHAAFSSAVSSHPAVPNGFDPPKHGDYHQIVNNYFTPEHMHRFEPGCRRVAQELVHELPRGEIVEFIDGFALS